MTEIIANILTRERTEWFNHCAVEPSDPITALHHARSTLGKVRFSLEQDNKLLLSTKLAEAQVTIGEVLKELER